LNVPTQDGTKKRKGNTTEKKRAAERFHSNRLSSSLLLNPILPPHCIRLQPRSSSFLASFPNLVFPHPNISHYDCNNFVHKIGYRREGKKPLDIDGRSCTMERRMANGKVMWG